MPESSLPTAASGQRPGRRAGDPSKALPEDGGQVIAGLDLVRLVVSLLARAILFSVLGLLVWAVLPIAVGWQTTTVVTGSMVPRIYAGDVIVARPIPTGTAALGQILLVDDPDHAGRLRLHRYVETAPDGGLILRGDANPDNDSSPVTPEAVHGVAVLRMPFVGLPVVWFAEKNWGLLGGTLVAVAALTLAAASGTRTSRLSDDPEKPFGTPGQQPTREHKKPRVPRTRRRRRATVRGSRKVQAWLVLAAIPLLPSLMTSATAHAGFSAATPTTQTSSFSALASFPCRFTNPADSPYFFYPFDEGSGTVAADTSGNKQTGKVYGTPSRGPGTCGADNRALTLSGKDDYVSTGTTAITAPNVFTAEIWFKTNSKSGGRLIGFGNGRTNILQFTDRHLYMTNTGAITFGVATGWWGITPSTIASSPGYNNNAWHLATATMSAAGTTLYIDGTAVATDPNLDGGRSYDGTWRVGYDAIDTPFVDWPNATGDTFFAGAIDNAAVYPAALTPDQVKAHYEAAKPQ